MKSLFNFYIEPLGAKAPAFNTASSTFSYAYPKEKDLALLCQAQAYPVPFFR